MKKNGQDLETQSEKEIGNKDSEQEPSKPQGFPDIASLPEGVPPEVKHAIQMMRVYVYGWPKPKPAA